jgi:dTDP-4-amino-4,6-dideoxygalactose transaminase
MQAAVGECERRRHNAERMIARIGDEPLFSGDCGYLRLPVLLPTAEAAESFADAHRRLGVERSYPTALPDLPALGRAPGSGHFPGARALAARLVTLPTHSFLREGELERLSELVRAADGRIVAPTAD